MNELYKIGGFVRRGDGRGKKLGFPTANIALHKDIPEGIYAGSVTINGKLYYSAAFVGTAKTFHKTDSKVESYIFDFDKDIYGKYITVRLYQKMRGNRLFDMVEDLVEQMKRDVEEIKEFFAKERE
ncbi:MAG TPA: riboflavin kinase [Candidatus Acidoferrales bacterium]|nr:riboflavin kinase [Candidatus Acidoferrales bacterium]